MFLNIEYILILLPDGVGLKNFVYSSFPKQNTRDNIEYSYWNSTPLNLTELGYMEEKLVGRHTSNSDIYKRARKIIEIDSFIKKTGNNIYSNYLFKSNSSNVKSKLKNLYESLIVFYYKNNLIKLREKIVSLESESSYYYKCFNYLKKNNISILLNTNQRILNAVAPVQAAKKLGIPTVNFIFSWDNLPKATMVVETDHYFVWSEYMKNELLYYYPYVEKDKIHIVGTPQFEIHYDKSYLISKENFFNKYNLDLEKDYICFSGDDITTSPHDPEYLRDIAMSIRDLNKSNRLKKRIEIIFRPCPVDYSNRFHDVLNEFIDEIHLIRPEWKSYGGSWNKVMPSQEDQILLANTVKHTKMVINVGSSMVFDYAAQNKPCAYINYNPNTKNIKKDIHKIYQYIHFESMPNKDAVIWLNSKEEIANKILEGLNHPEKYVANAQKWFKVINKHPPQMASQRIVEAIEGIITNK
ncbi:UDP-glycosyltransferase [Flavobacteriaceae bacterium 14752]|uniref:UDP-glycosyltransferase n=1 Tax=Mesohalobacter salilacus TaxID=2491711 RepID=UPI000F644930|nr:UDP-glycosyltransferase [Flavobacteriaceae bacterium 14752]